MVDGTLDRFWHPYYLLRVLACCPALFYWLLVSVPGHSFSEQQIKLISSYQLTLTIPLVALPTLVLLRLGQIRSKFHLLALSPETVLDAWLTHFVAFNFGSLGFLGGWIAAVTYLSAVVGFSVLFPKPLYLGQSKLKVMSPESFVAEVLNQTYSSVVGFSPNELLNLTPEKLHHARRVNNKLNIDNIQFQTNTWIVWPVSESSKRSQVGFIDMESILASLSLECQNSQDLKFVILDMKNSLSLCSSLKIWAEDDSISARMRCEVDDFVLLKYQAGKEIDRLPPRKLLDDDSSDEEESPVEKQAGPINWSKETIIIEFDLN